MPGYTDGVRTALVTGAAGVLGRSMVSALFERGHNAVLVDVDREGLENMAREYGDRVKVLCMDLGDAEDIRSTYASLEEEHIAIDILVNNAGILTTNKVAETSLKEWERVMNVNLTACFCLAKLVIPGMKQRGWGRIINITSLAAKTGGITAGTAYSVSKGALIALTFTLAAELAGFGVTVNGIAPAYVRTPMVSEQLTEEQRQQLLAKIPVGRFCEPGEVAHTVDFLVDDNAGFITGEIIDQNGGLLFD